MYKKLFGILVILAMIAALFISCNAIKGKSADDASLGSEAEAALAHSSDASAEEDEDSEYAIIKEEKPALGIDPRPADNKEVSQPEGQKPAGGSGNPEGGAQPKPADPAPEAPVTTPKPNKSTVNLPPPVKYVKTPSAPGTNVEISTVSGESVIDYSNASQGYVMVKNSGAANKLKVLIQAPNSIDYQYAFEGNGEFITCPLQAGNGKYMVQIGELRSGTTYSPIAGVEVNVALADVNLPFLYPNHRVKFTESSACVAKAAELTRGMTTDLEKIEAIYCYIIENIKYDKAKAETMQAGYVADPDRTFREGKGVCSDYSALLAAMLRSQKIPVKIVEGKAAPNNVLHMWNMVYTNEKGIIDGNIEFTGTWKILDATYGASLGKGLEKFIGNGSSYIEEKSY